jgi:PST family polysaccharide transporter
VNYVGLSGAGVAFFASYVFHGVMIYAIVRRLTGFRWSIANIKTGLLFLSSIAVVFCGFYALPFWWATGLGTVATVLSGVYSLRVLLTLVSPDRIPRPLQRLLVLLRFARVDSRK